MKETPRTFELFEAVIAVNMNIRVLRNVTPCSLVYRFKCR